MHKKRLSPQLQLIAKSFRQSIEQLEASEAELTNQILSIEDSRLALLETVRA